MGAGVDCEAIGLGLLGQPVNALSSLSMVVAALVVLSRDRWVASALAATGVGSFLFHGPLAPGGEWIHDVTLAWLIVVVGSRSRGWERRFGGIGLAGIAPFFYLAPSLADPLTVVLVVATLLLLVSESRRFDTLAPIALLGLSAIVGRLGSTGGPWCDPESVLQTHALWHTGAAVAVGWWAIRHAERNRAGVLAPSTRASSSDAELS
ncbi:MAG: hypothetical protein OEQ47_10710 [Acidimicrobiia bacterium]|nr:hypothetical protein [Acidimicrobiia bacterium]